MVYPRHGEAAVRGVIRGSGTATSAIAFWITFQLIVFHAGNAHFPHLLVLADGCLRKPAAPHKKDPESQSKERDSQHDGRYQNDF